jgi:hypothetical protein
MYMQSIRFIIRSNTGQKDYVLYDLLNFLTEYKSMGLQNCDNQDIFEKCFFETS